MHHLLFILLCLIWGASFILMKKAGLAFGPMSIGAWRLLAGAAILALLWPLRRQRWPLRLADLAALTLVAVVGSVWPYSMQPHLITKYQDSGFFGLFVGLTALMTIGVSIPLLGRYPTRRQVFGVIGGLAFLALIGWDGLHRSVTLRDLLLGLTIPLSYAISNTYVSKRFGHVSSLAVSCAAMTLAGILLLPLSVSLEPVNTHDRFPLALASLAVLGILGTGVGVWISYKLIRERGPLYAGMSTNLVPIGGLLWGKLDHEGITIWQVIGLAGVLASVILVQTDPGRRAEPTPVSPGVPLAEQ